MRFLVPLFLAGAVAACGGRETPPASPGGPATASTSDDEVPAPHQTELERRRDAACEQLGPKLTECAAADAKKTMSPEELKKLDLDKTAPVHTRKFIEECKQQQLSSRQVRVYEVCLREETACEPLVACLDNAKPQTGQNAPAEKPAE